MPDNSPEVQAVLDRVDFRSFYSDELRQFHGMRGHATALCPFHEDHNPSFSVNMRTGVWFCHACQIGGSIFQYIERRRGVGFPDALSYLANRFGVTLSPVRDVVTLNGQRRPTPEQEQNALDNYRGREFEQEPEPEPRIIDEAIHEAFHSELWSRPDLVSALRTRRHLTTETIDEYRIGFNPQNGRYTIPIFENSQVVNIRQWHPQLQPKMISWREGTGRARLFPADSLIPMEVPIYIMEGEWDCLLARQLGLPAFTATGGAGTWDDVWSLSFAYQSVIIVYDNDDAGRTGARRVAESLIEHANSVRIFNWDDPFEGRGRPREGYDFSDWIGDGGHLEYFVQRAMDTSPIPFITAMTPSPFVPVRPEQTGFEILPPPPADIAIEGPHPSDEDAENLTDTGNALRFVRMYGENLRYSAGTGWLVWEGMRWKPDEDESQVMTLAIRCVRSIYREAESADIDDTARRKIARHAQNSEALSRLQALIRIAATRPGIVVEPEALDADHWQFNTLDGTFDLRTMTVREHTREDLITKLAPVHVDPDNIPVMWHRFIDLIMRGDMTLQEFLQRAVGYAMTGMVSEQVLFMLYGHGANGKTILLEMLSEAFGDYATTMNFSTLSGRTRQGPSEDVARLRGHRFVTSIETGRDTKFNETLLRQLTGGDQIAARVLYHGTFTFHPVFKLFIACNERPEIRGTDHAIWRRVKLVPFLQTWSDDPDERANGALPRRPDEEVRQELRNEFPAIVWWAMQGCRRWQESGLGDPPEVREAVRAYRADMDDLAGFLEQRCVRAEDASIVTTELYSAFEGWCEANDREPLTAMQFGRRLTQLGYPSRRRSGTMCRTGLTLIPEAHADTSAAVLTEPDF